MSFSSYLHTFHFSRNQVSLQFSSISITVHECKNKYRGKIHKSCGKWTSVFTFRREGILTVEAGICIALFMFASLSLMSLFQVTETYMKKQHAITQTAKKQSVFVESRDAVDIDISYGYKPSFMLMSGMNMPLHHKVYIKCWTGYKPKASGTDAGEDKKVYYVTDYESVYHTSKECSHLKLSIRLVHESALSGTVNGSGGYYTPCEKCGKCQNISGNCYVTEEGRRYHTSLSCSGLKRTVYQVTDVHGLSPCSRCG